MAEHRRRPSAGSLVHLAASIALLASAAAAAYLFSGFASPTGHAEAPPVATQRRPPPAVATGTPSVRPYDGAIPVLTYHDVSDDGDGRYALTPERFAEHMAALDAAGFATVGLDDVRALASGTPVDLPSRPVLVTFDDGVLGTWTEADPILREHGFRAVAFIVTGVVPEHQPSYYLSWKELRRLARSGRWEVGGHTHQGHRQLMVDGREQPWLTHLAVSDAGDLEPFDAWRARVEKDMDTNLQLLRDRLGSRPVALSYPFSASRYPTNHPAVPGSLRRIVAERFDMAFTAADTPRAVTEGDDLLLLPRLTSITVDVSGAELIRSIERAIPRPPPRDVLRLRWTPTDGSCRLVDGALVVHGASYATCQPDIANQQGWDDYRLAVDVVGAGRAATAVIALRHSPSGRVEVAIGESSYVVREQHEDGSWSELERVPLVSAARRSVDVSVQGRLVSVTVDDRRSGPHELSPALEHGGLLLGVATRTEQAISFFQPTIHRLVPPAPGSPPTRGDRP